MPATQLPTQKCRFIIHLLFLSFSALVVQLPMHFLIFYVFHCYTVSFVCYTSSQLFLQFSLHRFPFSFSLSFSLFFPTTVLSISLSPPFVFLILFFFSYHRLKTMPWCCCSPNVGRKWGKCRTKNSKVMLCFPSPCVFFSISKVIFLISFVFFFFWLSCMFASSLIVSICKTCIFFP